MSGFLWYHNINVVSEFVWEPGKAREACRIYDRITSRNRARTGFITGPSGRVFAGVLFAAFIQFGFLMTEARAMEYACDTPTYIDGDLAEVEVRGHFHPSVSIIIFARSTQGTGTLHDVVKLITPPHGLGIDKSLKTKTRAQDEWHYRRIHSHEDDGVLHVEPVEGGVLRLCQFLKLWAARSDPSLKIADLPIGRSAHVRIGDEYTKNMPIEKILKLPLNHNSPIILFIERATAM